MIATRIVDAIVAEQEKLGGCLPNAYTRGKWAEAVELVLMDGADLSHRGEKPVIQKGEPVYLIGQTVYDRLDAHHDAIMQLRNLCPNTPEDRGWTPLGERRGGQHSNCLRKENR